MASQCFAAGTWASLGGKLRGQAAGEGPGEGAAGLSVGSTCGAGPGQSSQWQPGAFPPAPASQLPRTPGQSPLHRPGQHEGRVFWLWCSKRRLHLLPALLPLCCFAARRFHHPVPTGSSWNGLGRAGSGLLRQQDRPTAIRVTRRGLASTRCAQTAAHLSVAATSPLPSTDAFPGLSLVFCLLPGYPQVGPPPVTVHLRLSLL